MIGGAKILVVDDDASTRALVRGLLERAGGLVDEAHDASAGLRRLEETRPDVVILDIGLPRRDGWWMLARLRESSDVPVVMLTARAGELERVRGLNAGADDYVVKPFGRQELVARVNAVLRRTRAAGTERAAVYRDGYLTIDHAQGVVRVRGRDVELTPLELRLLVTFVRRPNIVLGHEPLRRFVWGGSRGVSLDEVKVYVSYLRRKLEPEQPTSAPIETVRGFGYRYRTPDSATEVGERQANDEGGADARLALDGDLPAVGVDDRLRHE